MKHTIVICGNGQFPSLLAMKVEQDSVTTQVLVSGHHPQSSDNESGTDKHDGQVPAKAEQLYNTTVDGNLYSLLSLHINHTYS